MLVPLMTVPILIFSIILVITSVALALFVLMHKGRGGGLSDLFSGISSSLVDLLSQNEISTDSPSSSEWSGWRQSWRSTCSTSWAPDCSHHRPVNWRKETATHPQLGRARENERGWWKRHSWQSGGGWSDGRGRAGRRRPAALRLVLLRTRS